MSDRFNPASMPLPPGALPAPANDELIAQLDLCLSILLGERDYNLSVEEEKLLRLEPNYAAVGRPGDDGNSITGAVKGILMEIILTGIPQPVQQIDLRLVVVRLLKQIESAGGMIPRKDIALPDELVKQLEDEGVLSHGDGGICWGRFAARAIEDVEAEYGSIQDDAE